MCTQNLARLHFLTILFLFGEVACSTPSTNTATTDTGADNSSQSSSSGEVSDDDDDDDDDDNDDDDNDDDDDSDDDDDDDNDDDDNDDDDDDDNDDDDDDDDNDDDDDDDESTESGEGTSESGDETTESGEESSESGDESTESSEESSESGDDDIITIYKETCGECHGNEGEGVKDKGYELRHPTREYFKWVTRNGRPGLEFPDEEMPEYTEAELSDEQLDEIWDYLDEFPKPTTGKGLWDDYCGSCHGAEGRGGPTGSDAQHEPPQAMISHTRSGEHLNELGNREKYMPAYDTTWLSNAEINMMTEYLDTVNAPIRLRESLRKATSK